MRDSSAPDKVLLKEPIRPRRPRELRRQSPPAALSLRLRIWIERWKERAASARQYQTHQIEISGREKATGEQLRTSYFGTCNHLSYIQDWIYDEHSLVAKPRKGTILEARRWATVEDPGVDLRVADLSSPHNRLLHRWQFLECPAWLNQRLPLGQTWQEVKTGFRKSARTTVLRRIRKYQLKGRFTREPEAVVNFYHEMYVPYLERRFRKAAFIEPFDRLRWFVENGTLLQVVREDRVIGAAVLYGWGRTLDFLWVGLKNDLRDDASAGAFGALYYYGILHAFEQGFDEVDLSGTRALLNDGVYRFKRQWGARVCDGWCMDSLLLEPKNLAPAVAAFLERSPMVVRQPRGLAGKSIYVTSTPTFDDLNDINRLYASDGIKVMKLVSIRPLDRGLVEAAHQHEARVQLVDLSRSPNPLRSFVRA